MVPLCSEFFSCCCSRRDSFMLPLRCMQPSSRSTPVCHRFGQVLASLALFPCAPRRPRGEMTAVPCGARSDARLLPASSSQPRSAHFRSVRTYNTTIYIFLKFRTILTFLGDVQLFRKKRIAGSPRRFRSCLDEREPVRQDRRFFLLFTHANVPTARTGGGNGPGWRAREPHTSQE